MKQNIIHQIEMKRVRYNHNESFALIQQLKDYESMCENHTLKNSSDYNQYHLIPVIICSAFESFFRAAIKELIDKNIAQRKKIISLDGVGSLKFNLFFWIEFSEKEITIGELVSELVKIRKIKTINSLLSILLDKDFLASLKTFSRPIRGNIFLATESYWLNNYNQILKDIDSVYDLRNIVCHEFGSWFEVKKETLLRYLKHSIVFLEQVDNYISNLSNPTLKKPKRVKEETIAKKDFVAREKELEELVTKISKAYDDLGYDNGPFDEAFSNEIILWKQYRKKLAKSNCEPYIGTNYVRVMYWRHMEYITQEKINSLLTSTENLFFELEIHSKVQRFD